MSNSLVASRANTDPAALPIQVGERRRPGRVKTASPLLIGLMRNPASTSARMRVALYDAPGFLLPPSSHRPGTDQRSLGRMMVALIACSAASTAVFKAMLLVWG